MATFHLDTGDVFCILSFIFEVYIYISPKMKNRLSRLKQADGPTHDELNSKG